MLKSPNPRVSWVKENAALDIAIYQVVRTLADSHKPTRHGTQLSAKEEQKLADKFKAAAFAKSNGHKFMRAIAEAIGIQHIDRQLFFAKGKDWERFKEKSLNGSRQINDGQRGRIYLSKPERYVALKKLLKSMSKEGQLKGVHSEGVSIIPDSINDYLEGARKSGFAGALNLSLEIDLGKGRTGNFEIQFMPSEYEPIDKLSHRLFDMIRIIQELPPAFKTEELQKIEDGLVLANSAIYSERGNRSGFIDFRKDKLPEFTRKTVNDSFEILERIYTQIESLGGRSLDWKKETAAATTEAKTALMNMQRAHELNQKTKPARTRKPKDA